MEIFQSECDGGGFSAHWANTPQVCSLNPNPRLYLGAVEAD